MIKVAVHGANGRLGTSIISKIKEDKNFLFTGAITSEYIPECDVIIDVSSDIGVTSLIKRLSKQKLIVGATGNLPDAELEKYGELAAVYIVPNFSKGIQTLLTSLQQLTEDLDNSWEYTIEETHHTRKKDNPSGTAKRLAQVIENNSKKVSITSKREGDTLGIHTISISSPSEKITITHETHNRDAYAEGAIQMINSIMQKENGVFKF